MLTCAFVLTACREAPPPPYVRLGGPAPAEFSGAPEGATLVVFWASWCAPCREETPELVALAEAPPEGISVVVFSADASMEDVRAFFEGPPPAPLHLRMDDGAVSDAFGVEALPASVFMANGRLLARFDGPRAWDSSPMRKLLARLLKESTSSGHVR